jgi:hypothetical protein
MWCCEISKYLFTSIHMSINYLGSERRLASSSPWVSLCGGTMSMGWQWKRTTTTGGTLMLWCFGLGGGKMETWLSGEESGQDWDDIFIVVEGSSRSVRVGWPVVVVLIQCFGFSSRREAMGRVLPEDEDEAVSLSWLHGKEAWHGMARSAGGEAAPERGKEVDDAS